MLLGHCCWCGRGFTRRDVDNRDIWVSELDSNCRHDDNRSIEVNRRCVTEEQCTERGWSVTGNACYDDNITHSVPDVFLLSVILFLGTFIVAMALRRFRTTRFFPTIVCRFVICDFFNLFLDLLVHSFIFFSFAIQYHVIVDMFLQHAMKITE